MHPAAFDAFGRMAAELSLDPEHPYSILDVGGRWINGSVHAHLPAATWTVLDIASGENVDIVADASTWNPTSLYDLVVSTELFEHTPKWREIIATMVRALDPAGPQTILITCAGTDRAPHGAAGEATPPPGEHYGNISPEDLRWELHKWFDFAWVEYSARDKDCYAWARGPKRFDDLSITNPYTGNPA